MLLKKGLLSTLSIALILGFSAQTADADTHKRHHPRTQAEHGKLHPACKNYLDRRAAWYKYKGNRAELKKTEKPAKLSVSYPIKNNASNAAPLTKHLMISIKANSAVNNHIGKGLLKTGFYLRKPVFRRPFVIFLKYSFPYNSDFPAPILPPAP